jgi:hypothetical protein
VAELDAGLIAVMATAVFFLVWYYVAFLYSRRLAGRVAQELKEAVVNLGGTSRIQWFGTSAFRMTTEEAETPFRQVSITVTLRPREMPINWAIGTAQGRRDAALVEASLRKDPKVDFELVDPTTRLGRRRKRAKSTWSDFSLGGRALLLSADNDDAARRVVAEVGPEMLRPVVALHVTAGKDPGIAASVSVEPGDATRGLAAIRRFGDRLAA